VHSFWNYRHTRTVAPQRESRLLENGEPILSLTTGIARRGPIQNSTGILYIYIFAIVVYRYSCLYSFSEKGKLCHETLFVPVARGRDFLGRVYNTNCSKLTTTNRVVIKKIYFCYCSVHDMHSLQPNTVTVRHAKSLLASSSWLPIFIICKKNLEKRNLRHEPQTGLHYTI